MIKVCDICGREFNALGKEKRCSSECKRKGNLNTHIKYNNENRINTVQERYFRKIVNNISTYLISHIIKNEIGCMKCGSTTIPHYALDYHHVGEKYYDIGTMITSGTMYTFLDEILKCKILCANCHREEHYSNKRNGIY